MQLQCRKQWFRFWKDTSIMARWRRSPKPISTRMRGPCWSYRDFIDRRRPLVQRFSSRSFTSSWLISMSLEHRFPRNRRFRKRCHDIPRAEGGFAGRRPCGRRHFLIPFLTSPSSFTLFILLSVRLSLWECRGCPPASRVGTQTVE